MWGNPTKIDSRRDVVHMHSSDSVVDAICCVKREGMLTNLQEIRRKAGIFEKGGRGGVHMDGPILPSKVVQWPKHDKGRGRIQN